MIAALIQVLFSYHLTADRNRWRSQPDSTIDLCGEELDYYGNTVRGNALSREHSEFDIENDIEYDKGEEKRDAADEGSGILPPLRSFATYLRLW